jgi:hypothetical protein
MILKNMDENRGFQIRDKTDLEGHNDIRKNGCNEFISVIDGFMRKDV